MLVRSDCFFPAVNFSRGRSKHSIKNIVLFSTLTTGVAKTISICQDPKEYRSYHFVIGRKGELFQTVTLRDTAWHSPEFNKNSIGIALCSTGLNFTKNQYDSLISLLEKLVFIFGIEEDKIVGFEDIADLRMPSPGPNFDWDHVLTTVYLGRPVISRNKPSRLIRVNKEFLGKNVFGPGTERPTTGLLFGRNFIRW